jgi:DNA-directed RNA polymerase subunit L
MELKILKEDKESIEIEVDNLTLAELLRVELWKDEATEFAAWKRDHPSKPCVLALRTKGKAPKKVIQGTIEKIIKENEKLLEQFKKMK